MGHWRRGKERAENRAARRFWLVLRPLHPGPGPQCGPFEWRNATAVHRALAAVRLLFRLDVPILRQFVRSARRERSTRSSPNLHAPYIMQSAFSLERQVTKIANVTLTYLNSRGVHQFESLNVNAPLPGTPGTRLQWQAPRLSVLVGWSLPPKSANRAFQHTSRL